MGLWIISGDHLRKLEVVQKWSDMMCVGLYDNLVLVTLCGGGAGSTVGGGAEENPIASSSSQAS